MRHKSTQVSRGSHRIVSLVFAGMVLGSSTTADAQRSLQQALRLSSHDAVVLPFSTPAPATTTEAALHQLANEAGIIFSGQVLRVQPDAQGIRIDFRVDDGIRGALTGQTLTIHEWAGLWVQDAARYRVGQRALFLLHAPSVGGFTTPVGGSDGVIPLSGDAVSASVDLRWIAARVARTIATRPDNAPDGTTDDGTTVYLPGRRITASVARQTAATANGVAWPVNPQNGNLLGTDLHSIDHGLVTGLLRAWNTTATTREAQ